MTIEQAILELLKTATKAKPIKNAAIASSVYLATGERLSERRVKKIISGLRNRAYPILASREKPFGYFWCGSIQELKDYETTYLNQAKKEFKTMRNMRKNYQILAGQQSLV